MAKTKTFYYNMSGEPIHKDDPGQNKGKACKVVEDGETSTKAYYLKFTEDNEIMDPAGRLNSRFSFARVAKSCFDEYINYLKTKNKQYLLSCQQLLSDRPQVEYIKPEDVETTDTQFSVKLSESDKTFIEQNYTMPLLNLQENIQKPLSLIEKHLEYTKSTILPKKKQDRLTKETQRNGATVLTENLSEAGDKFLKSHKPSFNNRSSYIAPAKQ